MVLRANTVLDQSDAGSVVGGGLNQETRSRVNDWINQAEPTIVDAFSSSNTSRDQMTPASSTFEDNETVVRLDGEDSDCDEEFEIEFIQASLQRANILIEKAKYSDAEQFFRKATVAAKTISLHSTLAMDWKDVQLKIVSYS